MNEVNFYTRVAYALSSCQLVEQELKLYITEALQLARKCIGNKMVFKYDGRDYENCSLERLIDTFRKLSDADVLIVDLRKFMKERNFLSHQAIVHCLDPDGGLVQPSALALFERLTAIQEESIRLQAALNKEANKFRGHLWFDNLSSNECN